MMLSSALALSLASVVDVRATVECVEQSALEAALENVGGVDVAENVRVAIVDDGPPDTEGRPRYLAVIDISLINAPHLARAVPIRPLECPDVPDLVALLVAEQRGAAVAAPRRSSPTPRPEPSRAPHTPMRYASPGCGDVCCGPPPERGGTALSVVAGPVATLGVHGLAGGARGGASFALGVDEQLAVTAGIEAMFVSRSLDALGTLALHVGPEWRWRIEDAELSVRPSLGFGGAVRPSHGYAVVASTAMAVRLRVSWLALEGGAFTHATSRWSPSAGLYAAVGTRL